MVNALAGSVFAGPVFITVRVPAGDSAVLAWDASPDPSVVGYRIYASTNKNDWRLLLSTTNLSATITNIFPPQWFAATAFDTNGLDSDFSNKLLLVQRDERITVTAEHAPDLEAVWVEYAMPIFTGTNVSGHDYFRTAAKRAIFWRTMSEP